MFIHPPPKNSWKVPSIDVVPVRLAISQIENTILPEIVAKGGAKRGIGRVKSIGLAVRLAAAVETPWSVVYDVVIVFEGEVRKKTLSTDVAGAALP